MPTLESFGGDREAYNAYFREYRRQNLLKLRKYNRMWMRRRRADIREGKKFSTEKVIDKETTGD